MAVVQNTLRDRWARDAPEEVWDTAPADFEAMLERTGRPQELPGSTPDDFPAVMIAKAVKDLLM